MDQPAQSACKGSQSLRGPPLRQVRTQPRDAPRPPCLSFQHSVQRTGGPPIALQGPDLRDQVRPPCPVIQGIRSYGHRSIPSRPNDSGNRWGAAASNEARARTRDEVHRFGSLRDASLRGGSSTSEQWGSITTYSGTPRLQLLPFRSGARSSDTGARRIAQRTDRSLELSTPRRTAPPQSPLTLLNPTQVGVNGLLKNNPTAQDPVTGEQSSSRRTRLAPDWPGWKQLESFVGH